MNTDEKSRLVGGACSYLGVQLHPLFLLHCTTSFPTTLIGPDETLCIGRAGCLSIPKPALDGGYWPRLTTASTASLGLAHKTTQGVQIAASLRPSPSLLLLI